MFDASVLWPALADAGMLKEAKFTLQGGEVKTVKVGFVQPDILMLQGAVQAGQEEIEYQTADLPGLSPGARFEIGSEAYRVKNWPAKQGDGYFSKVAVEKERVR